MRITLQLFSHERPFQNAGTITRKPKIKKAKQRVKAKNEQKTNAKQFIYSTLSLGVLFSLSCSWLVAFATYQL